MTDEPKLIHNIATLMYLVEVYNGVGNANNALIFVINGLLSVYNGVRDLYNDVPDVVNDLDNWLQ